MTNCPGQLLELIESPCQLTVTAPPQLSLVVTLFVSGAGTWLAQLSVRLVGQVMFGGLVSLTVIVCVQVALLPHWSVARYVRLTTNCPGQLLELIESPCQLTVTAPPQLSLVVTLFVSGAGTWLAQLTVRLVGQVMFGGLVSLTVMVCMQVALLPHWSVARYVRLMTNCPAQLLELIESPCQVTVTGPPQASLVVTLLVFGGTCVAQLAVRLVGQVMLGGLVSLIVMVWIQEALLPH